MQTKICPICETDAYSKIEYEENLPKKRENINFAFLRFSRFFLF